MTTRAAQANKLLEIVSRFEKQTADEYNIIFKIYRQATFEGFVFDKQPDAACTSQKLAEAGFVLDSTPDQPDARCPFCTKTLQFDPEDDPWDIHQSRCPDCAFVKIGKLRDEDFTVKDYLLLIAAIRSTKALSLADEFSTEIETVKKTIQSLLHPKKKR